MSVCENDGRHPELWPMDYPDCPCLKRGDKYDDLEVFCGLHFTKNLPPDSCPHAAALKAVVENPELVLVAQKKDCYNCKFDLPASKSEMCLRCRKWNKWESKKEEK